MPIYDTRIRHTKHNFDNGPDSHRRKYLPIDLRKHNSRKCHTYSRTLTYTHSIQLNRSRHYTKDKALIPNRNHMIRKHCAKATVNQALCICVSHEDVFELSSIRTSVQTIRCFVPIFIAITQYSAGIFQYVCSDGDRLHFAALPWNHLQTLH